MTIFIGQFAIFIMLIIVIGGMISNLTKPLNNLSEAIERFGKGEELEDIKIETKDEVAVLANNFNFMKNEIKDQMKVIINEQNKSREFFNNATHELKTPITAISGYTQLLIDNDICEIEEAFRDRALDRIIKESNKLNSLVKNILEISRGEVKRSIVKEEFDLGNLINSKISDMNIRIIKAQIKLNVAIYEFFSFVNISKDFLSSLSSNIKFTFFSLNKFPLLFNISSFSNTIAT